MFGQPQNPIRGNTQQVCSFYLKGQCKYGTQCWNLHPPSQGGGVAGMASAFGVGGNVFGAKAGTQQDSKELNEFTKQVSGEMVQWERSGLWRLSSFTPLRSHPLLAGFSDHSPEELRMQAYEALKTNTSSAYQEHWNKLQQQYKQLRDALKVPTPEAYQAMKDVFNAKASTEQQNASQAGKTGGLFGKPSAFGGSTAQPQPGAGLLGAKPQQSLFGGIASPFGGTSATQANTFGDSAKKSLFGGTSSMGAQSTSGFGTQPNASPFSGSTSNTFGGGSVFGGPPKIQGSGIFGGGTAASSANPAASSIFGGGAAANPTSASGSIFGGTSTAAGSTGTSNIFGGAAANAQSSGSNIFGGTAAGSSTPATGSIFGGSANTAAPAGGSIFGQPQTPSVFGNNQSTPTFGGMGTTATSTPFGASGTVAPSTPFGVSSTVATSTPFGGSGTTATNPLFGGPATTATSTPFGGSSTQSVFGGASTVGSSGGLFGAKPLFGAQPTQPQQQQQPTTPSLFGNPPSTAPGIFGAHPLDTQAQSTTSSVFGGSTVPTFGTANPLVSGGGAGLFGNPPTSQSGSIFGGKLNEPNSTNQGLFGNPAGVGGSSVTASQAKANLKEEYYTKIDQLDPNDKAQFEADTFAYVPLCPPPIELCL